MGGRAQPDRDPDGGADARRRRGRLALKLAARIALALLAVHAARSPAGEFRWQLPRGFPTPAVPAGNPMSTDKVALGRRLFFETRLSVTGRYSCASCHQPQRAYTDGRARAVGATGGTVPHGTMSLYNVAYNLAYGWQQPLVTTLERQMRQPLLNRHPVEIGLDPQDRRVVARLADDADYPTQFAAAFGGDARISTARIIQAVAAFERTLIAGHSPFDTYVFEGRHEALSPGAKLGMALFFSARLGCAGCHSGFNFSGNWRDSRGATGRASFADDGLGAGPMRVPSLRNVTLTAPYMHDGRFATLDAVLDHYQRVGSTPDTAHGGSRDPRLKSFKLSRAERADLKAFLESLTDRDAAALAAGRQSD